jgi:hypothetical protein
VSLALQPVQVLLGARDQIRLAREQLLDLAVDRFRAIEIMPIQRKIRVLRVAAYVSSIKNIGLTQITDFSPFVGHFCPAGRKNDLQKKESTMLPQAIVAFA